MVTAVPFLRFMLVCTLAETQIKTTGSSCGVVCLPVKVVLVIGGGLHMGDLLLREKQTYTYISVPYE